MRAYLYLNRCCNLHCQFCASDDTNLTLIPEEKFDQISEFILNCSKNSSCNYLVISGGEPTLHPEIERIVKFASKYFKDIQLMTNSLSLADDAFAQRILSSGVTTVCTTIPSPQEHVYDMLTQKSGAFGVFLRGLQNIFRYRRLHGSPLIMIKTIVLAEALDSFRDFPLLFEKENLTPDCFIINGLHVGTKVLKNMRIPDMASVGEAISNLMVAMDRLNVNVHVAEIPLCILDTDALEVHFKNGWHMSANVDTLVLDQNSVSYNQRMHVKSRICSEFCIANDFCDGLPGKNFDKLGIDIDKFVRPIIDSEHS